MNPLHVLRGDMIMRRRDQLQAHGSGAGLRLDDEGRHLIRLDSTGRPTEATHDGQALPIRGAGDGESAGDQAGIYAAPAGTNLQSIVELCARSGHPVLLLEDGALCGICGEHEITRALAGTAAR
jgi:glycine betaine/proline transport system ATP-binding protein